MTAGRTVNSQNQDWATPLKYVKAVKKVFGGKIELDPCSNKYSIVDAEVEFMLPENDGLKEGWNYSTIYVNPPYGSDRKKGTTIKNWLAKCALAHKKFNSEVLALVPVATNTGHWKQSVFGQAKAVCLIVKSHKALWTVYGKSLPILMRLISSLLHSITTTLGSKVNCNR